MLSLAARRGVTVDGHLDAITRILAAWLDHWQQDGPASPRWPYWITREQLRAGTKPAPGPHGSWCYGTAGFARAQQPPALALKDPARQHAAECALLRAMADPAQLGATVNVSLGHGFASLAHHATRCRRRPHPRPHRVPDPAPGPDHRHRARHPGGLSDQPARRWRHRIPRRCRRYRPRPARGMSVGGQAVGSSRQAGFGRPLCASGRASIVASGQVKRSLAGEPLSRDETPPGAATAARSAQVPPRAR